MAKDGGYYEKEDFTHFARNWTSEKNVVFTGTRDAFRDAGEKLMYSKKVRGTFVQSEKKEMGSSLLLTLSKND